MVSSSNAPASESNPKEPPETIVPDQKIELQTMVDVAIADDYFIIESVAEGDLYSLEDKSFKAFKFQWGSEIVLENVNSYKSVLKAIHPDLSDLDDYELVEDGPEESEPEDSDTEESDSESEFEDIETEESDPEESETVKSDSDSEENVSKSSEGCEEAVESDSDSRETVETNPVRQPSVQRETDPASSGSRPQSQIDPESAVPKDAPPSVREAIHYLFSVRETFDWDIVKYYDPATSTLSPSAPPDIMSRLTGFEDKVVEALTEISKHYRIGVVDSSDEESGPSGSKTEDDLEGSSSSGDEGEGKPSGNGTPGNEGRDEGEPSGLEGEPAGDRTPGVQIKGEPAGNWKLGSQEKGEAEPSGTKGEPAGNGTSGVQRNREPGGNGFPCVQREGEYAGSGTLGNEGKAEGEPAGSGTPGDLKEGVGDLESE